MIRRLVPLSLLTLVALATWVIYARSDQPAGVLQELARARPERAFPARLSVPTVYRGCTRVKLSADSTVARERCGDDADMPVDVEHLAAAGESFAPDSLHASALTKVLWWDEKTASLDDAIARLSDALRLQEDSVPLMVDLAAVHLFRAQEKQSTQDLAASLNYARGAVAIEPRNQSALWNAALAAEALYLDVSADSAWSAYLAADPVSRWAFEARSRRRALRKLRASHIALDTPTVSSTDAEVTAFANRHPQQARELGWHEVLGAWGNAVLGDSTVRADSLLALASRLGAALVDRGGDASLADAVKAIHDAQRDPATVATLARAHAAYAFALLFFYEERIGASDTIAYVVNLQPPSRTLTAWARAFPREVDDRYLSVLSDSDTLRYPALAARVHWTWGRRLFAQGDYADAQMHYARASGTYAQLGEMENYGAMRAVEGWALYEKGDALAAYRRVGQAAAALRPYRQSLRLHNLLVDLAKYAARDGMPSAALVLHNEDVTVARQVSEPFALPEAFESRAMFYMARGEAKRANANLDSAAPLLTSLRDSNQVEFFSATRAVIGNRPASELDSAIAFFTRDSNTLWRMTALARRADLRLGQDDWQRAGADLDSITAQIEQASKSVTDYHLRSALIEQARTRFDQLVMLHVRAERPREALRALERGRVSFRSGTEPRRAPDIRLRGPEGLVVLEYALIGDTLLAWTIQGDAVTLDRTVVDRDSLVFAIERVDRALEHPGREAIARPLLEQLHGWLIRPVSKHLPDGARIVIVADGEIARVPFDALRDRQTGKDLVENHPLSFASRLADAGRTAPAAASSPLRALLVANPAFEAAEHPALNPLDGALAEMRLLRSIYPAADTLAGGNVSISGLRERAPRADVIHYAGHAIFDDAQPEQSFLVLAGRERLTAETVSRWDLTGVRLVVLSTCSTIRARHGRSGGFAGLSGAFLSAGVGGVIGSLWPVDDSLAQPLMEAFHHEYLKSRDPAEALRKAQLEMRRQRVSPTVWAGFRYVGG